MNHALLLVSFVIIAVAMTAISFSSILVSASSPSPIPLIIDTDIGTDFDDSWAITWVLSRPDLYDVKLIISATHDTIGRAKVLAKYLTQYGLKEKVPIGIGIKDSNKCGPLCDWAAGIDLVDYNNTGGIVYQDGVLRVAEILFQNPKMQFLALAPMDNFNELMTRFPSLKQSGIISPANQKFFAMYGGVHYCYHHQKVVQGTCREYNVYDNATAGQAWMKAPWTKTIAPLDVCSSPLVVMTGQIWQNFLNKANQTSPSSSHSTPVYTYPWIRVLTSSYFYWCGNQYQASCHAHSDTLFDPTAVLLMMTGDQLLNLTPLLITVTNQGELKVGPGGSPVTAALSWKNETAGPQTFFKMLTDSIAIPTSYLK